MKNILVFILSLAGTMILAQNPYYDAMIISKFVKNGKLIVMDSQAVKTYVPIFNSYMLRPKEKTDLKTVANAFRVSASKDFNPFLKEFFHSDSLGMAAASTAMSASGEKGVFPILGGLEIPNEILLGVTDWIVKRTQQELNIYFFEKFREQIEKYPDLKTVFPQTYQTLYILGDEIYNYKRYLKTLQIAFQQDAGQLIDHLPGIVENHPAFFERHPELKSTLENGFYIVGALQDEIHPGDILDQYPEDYLESLPANWKACINTIRLVSSSLRNNSSLLENESPYWVAPGQIRQLVSDKVAFKLFLGLIYQEAKSIYNEIPFSTKQGDTTLVDILNHVAAGFDTVHTAFASFLFNFSQKTNQLFQIARQIREEENDTMKIELYYTYCNTVLDLLEHSTTISKLPYFQKALPALSDSLQHFFNAAHSTADLFLNIRLHRYSSAMANAVAIYDVIKTRQGAIDAANLQLDESERDIARSFGATKKHLLHYGSFLASMSEASTPEDVEKVMETFALPQGSSRIKRHTPFNVALNAYCGLFTGNEIIQELEPNQPFRTLNSYGLTTPIGISVSQGKRYLPWPISEIGWFKKSQKGWASTWFFSLVDLGAVAAYRFTDDAADQVPTIQLGDIFSPGIFWSLGLPKSPLSCTVGAQVGPNLRKVNDAQNEYANTLYTRYSLSVCVDIPVFNFYTKSE